ncbi:MAG: hypothetical protein ACF8XB_24250 [Planctomycetota bacterium JB042]
MNLDRTLRLLAAATLGLVVLAGPAAAASAPTTPEPPTLQSSKHEHQWVKATKRVWVPPKYKKVKVGTDKKGKPIYEKRLVKKGEYKTVYVKKCKICGREK